MGDASASVEAPVLYQAELSSPLCFKPRAGEVLEAEGSSPLCFEPCAGEVVEAPLGSTDGTVRDAARRDVDRDEDHFRLDVDEAADDCEPSGSGMGQPRKARLALLRRLQGMSDSLGVA